MTDPEVIYLDPVCEACQASDAALWWEQEADAICPSPDCPDKPTEYIRADILTTIIEEITQNCEEFDTKERREMMETIAENKRLKADLDRLKAEIETPREQRGFS